jgi:hypothetical protein
MLLAAGGQRGRFVKKGNAGLSMYLEGQHAKGTLTGCLQMKADDRHNGEQGGRRLEQEANSRTLLSVS